MSIGETMGWIGVVILSACALAIVVGAVSLSISIIDDLIINVRKRRGL